MAWTCHDGTPHSAREPHTPPPGERECFGCKVKAMREDSGLTLGAAATPTQTKDRVKPRTPNCSWEAGVAGEHRPGGGFMPYLEPGTTSPMGIKQYSEERHKVDAAVDRLKHDPQVFAGKE